MAVQVFVYQGKVYDPPLDHFPKWDPQLATAEEKAFATALAAQLEPLMRKLHGPETD